MPRFPTFPTLYDDVKTLSIADLKKLGYLVPNNWRRGTVIWWRRGKKIGSIRVSVDIGYTSGMMELDYLYGEEPVKYKIPLESIPSNLGNGLVWYFRCPHTGKRCRKLYGAGKYFLHRDAFPGCLYESQIQSKFSRQFQKAFGWLFDIEKIEGELGQKYRKRHYGGKPTPLSKKLEKLNREWAKHYLQLMNDGKIL